MTDFGPGWKNPATIAISSSSMLVFHLCNALVEKGLFTQVDAASIFTKTANDVRSGTEDDVGAATGFAVATAFEQLAGWLLGRSDRL
jgi:hypothetical protein